jgi:D-sedoheptulose 7-phosphate isomerase
VLLISVSGESPNLIRAAETTRELGVTVLSLVGQPSRLVSLSDQAVVVGERDYGLCEDLHLAVNHVAVRILRGVRRFECSPSRTTESLPND